MDAGLKLCLIGIFFLTACATGPKSKHLSSEERARLWLDVGNGALSENDPTGALENFFKAQAEYPDMAELHHSMALAYNQKHLPEKAIQEAKRAVELNPDFSEANNTLGRLFLENGQAKNAVPYLEKAASDPIYRESYKAYTNLGILYYRSQDFSKAQKNFERAIESAPHFACVAFYYSGHLALRSSRLKDAIRDYEKAGEHACANFPDAHLALGVAYQAQHDFALARKKYLEVENNYPNTAASDQAIERLRTLP